MQVTTTLKSAITVYLRKAPPFMAIIRAQEIELFRKSKKYLTGNILDFGCGDGFFASVGFAPLKVTKELEGVDVPTSRIALASDTQVYRKITVYSGKKLPFKDKNFSTVVSNCVFEHIPDMPKSAREIYRVLKPGGFCVTGVMTKNWETMLWWRKIFGQKYVDYMRKQQDHVGLRTKEEWKKLFEKAGFKVISQTGYVGDQCGPWLDLAHYFSLPSLISYAINRNWVWFPTLQVLLWQKFVEHVIGLPEKTYAAEFFVLQRPSK